MSCYSQIYILYIILGYPLFHILLWLTTPQDKFVHDTVAHNFWLQHLLLRFFVRVTSPLVHLLLESICFYLLIQEH